MENFFEYCKDFIVDHLPDYEGQDVYACDLGMTITEGINTNGTATYSRQKAKEYIQEWWADAAEYSDYEKMNFGERSNPFENPEVFMVRMVIEGCCSILSKCPFIDENWNDEIEFTEKNIQTIIEQVNEVDEDESLF